MFKPLLLLTLLLFSQLALANNWTELRKLDHCPDQQDQNQIMMSVNHFERVEKFELIDSKTAKSYNITFLISGIFESGSPLPASLIFTNEKANQEYSGVSFLDEGLILKVEKIDDTTLKVMSRSKSIYDATTQKWSYVETTSLLRTSDINTGCMGTQGGIEKKVIKVKTVTTN